MIVYLKLQRTAKMPGNCYLLLQVIENLKLNLFIFTFLKFNKNFQGIVLLISLVLLHIP